MLFAYPLTKLLEILWMNQHGSFSSYCHVGFCVIFKEVIQVNKRFLPALEGLWWAIVLFFKRSPFVFHVLPVATTIWRIF
jgi:hypothetical protein